MGSDSVADKSERKERGEDLALAPIAKPLAGKKLCKKTLKFVRRAAEHKCLKRGVKEVVKSIRRGHKGLCVIAGNISPIDVITHVPILCEEADIPYIYVPSKEELATAGATKTYVLRSGANQAVQRRTRPSRARKDKGQV
ncbi:H/ACA ribonucleoprotein complex subunit 2 [Hibiscus syriacus]|uniref:H/ACA ribonucleoprotein complex subunit 2 n=1 Tax=Hibiscus syriacus TaxID=106335 RepID=A0A6A2YYK1_HIBSY|nr:H/ACA ribonucleoprotein complex subunit 2 [Hibiscus syriacus]